MPVPAVALLLLLPVAAMLISVLVMMEPPPYSKINKIIPRIWLAISSVISASIIFWLVVSLCQPTAIEREVECEVITCGDTQYIKLENSEMKNVNAMFGKTFTSGDKIKMILYKQTYCGLDYSLKPKFVIEPKAEKSTSLSPSQF